VSYGRRPRFRLRWARGGGADPGESGAHSAAAMCGPERSDDPAGGCDGECCAGQGPGEIADGTADENSGGDPDWGGSADQSHGRSRPWPLRRVRLTVEDSGCGMVPEQIDEFERNQGPVAGQSRDRTSRGARVGRCSAGELRVMSAPGIGTRCRSNGRRRRACRRDAADRSSVSHGAPPGQAF